MNCTLKNNLVNISTKQELTKLNGKNTRLTEDMVNGVIDKTIIENNEIVEQYKVNFTEWCTENNRSLKNANDRAKAIFDYYYSQHPSIVATSRLEDIADSTTEFGYTSNANREKAKQHSAVMILDEYNKNQLQAANKAKECLKICREKWLENIFRQIAILHAKTDGKNIDEIRKEYNSLVDENGKPNNVTRNEYVRNELKGVNVSTDNYYAVYQELFGSKAVNFINEIFRDKILQTVFSDVKEDLEILAASALEQAQQDGFIDAGELDDIDMSIIQLNNHIGMYANFMSHLGPRLLNYFNTLRKRNSTTNENDIEVDDVYGIGECMDANACAVMLYNQANTSNLKAFIDSVRSIGERVSGFEAFITFANYLENNLDFATEVATTFFKFKTTKYEVVKKDDGIHLIISNKDADASLVFFNDLRNDVKSVAIYNNDDVADSLIANITSLLSTKNPSDSVIARAKKDLISLVRYYFPSIQENAIHAYVNMESKYKDTNIKKLLGKIVSIKNSLDSVRENYDNYILSIQRNNLNNVENTIDTISDDYDSEIRGTLAELRGMLMKYSIVNTSFNSRNVYGNNNSDIINMSFITSLQRMLDQSEIIDGEVKNNTLIRWGKAKLRSNQYKYSNILLETKDKFGRIINRGLFYYADVAQTDLKITPYAKELLKVLYLNGTSNRDSGNNVSYPDMTEGDFIPTSFLSYHKTKAEKLVNDTLDLATYMLRTPSDAPKTFALRAPKYDTSNLIVVKDSDRNRVKNDSRNAAKNTYDLITAKEGEKYEAKKIKDISEDELQETIFPGKKIKVIDDNIVKVNDKKYLSARIYKGEKSVAGSRYRIAIEGKVITETEKGQPVKYFIVDHVSKVIMSTSKNNYLNETNSDVILEKLNSTLANYYYNLLLEDDLVINDISYKKAEYDVNVNDRTFTLLRKQFDQELLNAVTALGHLFVLRPKTNSGNLIVDINDIEYEEDGIIKHELKPVLMDESNTKGVVRYHLDKKGQILSKVETPNGIRYKVDGNVFHSKKFTLCVDQEQDDGTVKAVPVNFLDRIITTDPLYGLDLDENNNPKRDENGNVIRSSNLINFLYGGAIEIVIDSMGDVVGFEFDENRKADIEANITEQLKSFVKEYINQVGAVIRENKDFISGVKVNNNTITDYAINQLITYFSYDELFEGDSKFYKSAQDLLKRAKEVQASGVPYGIVDYTRPDNYEIVDVEKSYLNSKEIQDLLTAPYLIGTTQRTGFRAVTVYNTQATNTEIIEVLKNQLIKSGVSEEMATNILEGDKDKRKGFTETKTNDAQSYITIREWVRRIAARGQLQKYRPLIEKLNDPNAVLTTADIKEFVQVQKNVYFDLYYDDNYGIERPRFIKNAEFVLVPQLIKGTQLEEVFNLMESAGIDQINTIETSKASNVNVLTLWDNDGNISAERLQNFAHEAARVAEPYSYNYLYTQQETPQHMDSENKAGIQIMKKVIDNLPDSGKLGELKKLFTQLYVTNIEESFVDLLKELGIPLDNKGNIDVNKVINDITLNNKLFYKKLEAELRRTGMDSNAAKFVTIPEDSSVPEMPAYLNNFIIKFESLVGSIFQNSITRQKLPGFHSPQVTNVGWKNMGKDLSELPIEKLEERRLFNEYKEYIAGENKEGYTANVNDGYLTEDSKKHFIDYCNTKLPSHCRKLEYHPEGKPYIEVLVPYSYLGIVKTDPHYAHMSDEQILEELRAEGHDGMFGLDDVIGYRIPTEGKQSICNMKVVGFIDDAYGSTIIVPDDWVTQTGSDFDVDSVYGIQYETKKLLDGKVVKVNYKNSLNTYDWIDYVDRNLKILEKTEENEDEEVTDTNIIKNIKKNLRDIEKQFIKTIPFPQISNAINFNTKGRKQEAKIYITISLLNKAINTINANKEAFPNSDDIIKNFNYIIDFERAYAAFLIKDSDYLASVTNKDFTNVVNTYVSELNKKAKENNLAEHDTFINASDKDVVMKYNSRASRNTKILETMQEILSDPATLEETLYRSNCEELLIARDEVMDKNIKIRRDNRSAYNPIDQARFQEEAMSGAKLKALSVTMDTFCSICNKVKPTLNTPITVVYDREDLGNEYDNACARYNKSNKNDTVIIDFNQYGWSKDNRNVAGYLLTPYSSQTTAYILDAIKEGSIPNVNTYTFNIFKVLPNMGIDYRTSLSFIMQPAIGQIVRANNRRNSVFSSNAGNPIYNTIKDIAKKLGISVSSTTPVKKVLDELDKQFHDDFNNIFKGKISNELEISLNDAYNYPIVTKLNIDRLKHEGQFKHDANEEFKSDFEKRISDTTKKELLFDLYQVLIFNRLNNTAREISDIARCCNPDKFGAKQTVFATRQVFEDIHNCLFKKESITNTREINEDPVLQVNGKHILESIYPGCATNAKDYMDVVRNIANADINKSSYSTLCAFLKYASASSILISEHVLETEAPEIVKLLSNLSSVMSGYNPRIDETTYKDFRSYFLTKMYQDINSIKYPVRVKKENDEIILTIDDIENDKDFDHRSDADIKSDELYRIYGLSRPDGLKVIDRRYILDENGNPTTNENGRKTETEIKEVKIKNINDPKPEEMRLFEKLSPAQKVLFIKRYFSNSDIFDYINVETQSPWRTGHRITFIEQNVNPNIIYSKFRTAFYNSNPLVVSTAIDIIKYSVFVEGFKMSARAVNKIIDNTPLIEDFGENGLGFVQELRTRMAETNSTNNPNNNLEDVNTLYENYLRSHIDTVDFKTLYLYPNFTKKHNIKTNLPYGVLLLTPINEESIDEFNERLTEIGVCTELPLSKSFTTNKYIKVRSGKLTRIYKIFRYDDGAVYLAPLGKLEQFEHGTWSIKPENNYYTIIRKNGKTCLNPKAYAGLIRHYEEERINDKQFSYNNDVKIAIEDEIKESMFAPENKSFSGVNTKDFDIYEVAKNDSTVASALTAMEKHFADSRKPYFVPAKGLSNYIFSIGARYASPQTLRIETSTGRVKRLDVSISKPNISYLDKASKDKAKTKNSVESLEEFKKIQKDRDYKTLSSMGIFEVKVSDDAEFYSSGTESYDTIENETESIDTSYEKVLASANSKVLKLMESRNNQESDTDAHLTLRKFFSKGIVDTEKSLIDNQTIVTTEVASYAHNMAHYILDELINKFTEDPEHDGTYLPMDDPKVAGLMKDNKMLQDKFLRTYNLIKAFIESFGKYDELEHQSDDLDINRSINEIIKQLKLIKAIPIDTLANRFNRTIIADMSTNPLIKEDLVDVLENFWRNSSGMWKFNDIMENGNPLLQTILKDVMNEVNGKRLMTLKAIEEYHKKRDAIIETARRRNENINYDKFIDENGRRLRPYVQSLYDDLKELEHQKTIAAAKGYDSIEFQRAKLNYDMFITEHFNQPAKKEYYVEKNALVKDMLDKHPEIYSKYCKLHYRQIEILDLKSKGIWSKELEDEYRDLNSSIASLSSIENDDLIFGDNGFEYNIDKEAKALRKYIKKLNKLNSRYFTYKGKFGFEDKLNEALATIQKYEQRDANGVPTVLQTDLMKIPQYVNAFNWLRDNAKFELKEESGKLQSMSSFIRDALKTLNLYRPGVPNNAKNTLKEANGGQGIYDVYGIPNGLLLTDEEIAKIKEAKETAYKSLGIGNQSDRALISFAKPSTLIYSKAFYDNFVSAEQSRHYYKLVTRANKILEKYLVDGVINFDVEKEKEAEAITDFEELGEIYQELRETRKKGKTDKDWAEDHIEFVENTDAATICRELVNPNSKQHSKAFRQALRKVIYDFDRQGNKKYEDKKVIVNGKKVSRRAMNSMLFSSMQLNSSIMPGSKEYNKYVNVEATNARRLIDRFYVQTRTKYWEQAYAEHIKDGTIVEWTKANTVYNPYTREMEWLPCWMQTSINPDAFAEGTLSECWVPKGEQIERKVIDGTDELNYYNEDEDMRNPNYKENENLWSNYIQGSDNGKYDTKTILNQSEQAMLDLINETIDRTATTPKSRRFFDKGYMPMSKLNTENKGKRIVKETVKTLGINPSDQSPKNHWKEELSYSDDFIPDAPMTTLLNNKQTYDYEKKMRDARKELDTIDEQRFDSPREKELRIKELIDVVDDCKQHLSDIRASLINRDWQKVMDEYLTSIGRYNAISEVKDKMYYLLYELGRQKTYLRQYGLSGDLKKLRGSINDEDSVNDMSVDENLLEQYKVFFRRFIFDEWKKPEGYLTKMANAMQGFTSANYMMLNVKGGVANVTLGETGILAEAAAREYFGAKDWAFGTEEWNKGIIGFARRGFHMMYGEDKSFNKQDAIVQYFQVVDYDEKSGVVREINLEEYTKKLRDMLFSPQNIGEHFMQNSVLFAMLHSHKIVKMANGKHTYMSKQDYVRYRLSLLLEDMLSDEQLSKFIEFKNNVKKDKDQLKEYAWFRRDILTEFLRLHCSKEERNDFIAKRKVELKKIEDEFSKLENMYDQIEFRDGKMAFKTNSLLATLDSMKANNVNDMTEADRLLGAFSEKVKKVNNKIHGAYNRDSAAYIEHKWYGSLVMQYHKHLPIGILKHYRREGLWNETRESVEKGMWQSLMNVHHLNIRAIKFEKGLTDEEQGALEGFIFLITNIATYLSNLKDSYIVMPEYDKANIRRRLGNYIGVLGSLATVAGLWGIAGDDDMEDNLPFNFMLYEADRLASEAFMYNPVGFMNEVKKLMSSPIAAKSIIDDGFKTATQLINFVFDDEYDPYYHSGRFAGQPKLLVYIQRRIPAYSGIYNMFGLNVSNHYYKLGENPIGLFNIKDKVLGN